MTFSYSTAQRSTQSDTGRRHRPGNMLVAVTAIVVVASALSLPTSASATAPTCTPTDQRTASDKLPRPGVIVTDSTYGTSFYDAYTIDNDGSLANIYVNTPEFTTPLVSAWQNSTNCSGSEISRNSWAVGPTGRIYSDSGFSGPPAGNYGDASNLPLNKPIVGMSATSTGDGYWLVASDGGIFTYGDATFYGSTGALRLNKPIVGMTVTPSGHGYWMVASDGGIFSFGDAPFYGSTGAITLNKPISGMTATASGNGYWMVASDGGIFTFGDAPFRGSAGNIRLAAPIAGMVPHGSGYTLIGQDGQLYPFN
ncbi:MAG: hypothetical protein H7201_15250 [Candidatus Saccharibacteria bacterium]|nr:hypothetical protein [Microbacteriaceae bacterium]